MRIVITGATGFIGSSLTNCLKRAGHEVVGVSRSTCSEKNNIVRVESFNNLPCGDVLVHLAESNNRILINSQHGVDYIGQVSQVARDIIKNNFSYYIYASSVAVYANREEGVCGLSDENLSDDNYALAKLKVEKIFLDRKNSAVIRLSNIYGPGMSPLNVVSAIISQIKENKKVVELQSITPIRDFIWVDDVTHAINLIIEKKIEGKYNLGTGIGTSVSEMARTALEVAGKENVPVVAKMKTGPSCVVLDIDKTMRDLNWKPEITVLEGLKRLLRN